MNKEGLERIPLDKNTVQIFVLHLSAGPYLKIIKDHENLQARRL